MKRASRLQRVPDASSVKASIRDWALARALEKAFRMGGANDCRTARRSWSCKARASDLDGRGLLPAGDCRNAALGRGFGTRRPGLPPTGQEALQVRRHRSGGAEVGPSPRFGTRDSAASIRDLLVQESREASRSSPLFWGSPLSVGDSSGHAEWRVSSPGGRVLGLQSLGERSPPSRFPRFRSSRAPPALCGSHPPRADRERGGLKASGSNTCSRGAVCARRVRPCLVHSPSFIAR